MNNFFEQQDHARRESRKLLILFGLAVTAIVVVVNITLAVAWQYAMRGHGPVRYPQGFFVITTLGVLLFIGLGTLYQIFQLRDGGDAVAEMAGGRLVSPDSTDLHERRLLNVVEEMALASGIACPNVYILDEEDGINAFAAGFQQNQAVVAVTRGTLERLNRDELQGVVGHEFSHILNGDMRMNIQLIGVLFGIQMLALFGRELFEWGARFSGGSRSKDDKGPSLGMIMLVVGIVLFVVGYVGIFFGRLIQSAISRQREFLADASAVQFTRNPQGIGGALQKIGGLSVETGCGSAIQSSKAEQLSHMFLGAARPSFLSGMFATHPPLEERLRRVYGKDVQFVQADVLDDDEFGNEGNTQSSLSSQFSSFSGGSASQQAFTAAQSGVHGDEGFGHHAGNPAQAADNSHLLQSGLAMPDDARVLAREPQSATLLVCAMVCDQSQTAQAQQQQQQILRAGLADAAALQAALRAAAGITALQRLPLLDLAMPALKRLPENTRQQLLSVVAALIQADGRVSETEFVLQAILEQRLNPQAARAVKVRYADLVPLRKEVALVLSLVPQGDAATRQQMFMQGAASLRNLQLQATDWTNPDQLDYQAVRAALAQLNQLAPLAKPMLIRGMLQIAQAQNSLSSARTHELLRSVCAAIDMPVPDLPAMLQDLS